MGNDRRKETIRRNNENSRTVGGEAKKRELLQQLDELMRLARKIQSYSVSIQFLNNLNKLNKTIKFEG
ncbi:MAG: hypothetical protein LBD50_03750, partial [Rickettsiales bacterium]|nr:hypothetical protein [Rickettsiales bacterium]